MKRLTILLALLLVLSCVQMTVYAKDNGAVLPEVELYDDFRTAIVDGKEFIRFNCAGMSLVYEDHRYVGLTPQQKQTLNSIQIRFYEQKAVIQLEIEFSDGATLSAYYLQKDSLDDYHAIRNGQAKEMLVDFQWPEGNTIKLQKEALLGSPAVLKGKTLSRGDSFTVSGCRGGLEVEIGTLVYYEESFYYIDFAENGIDSESFISLSAYVSLSGWEVTDPTALRLLQAGLDAHYADDLGVFDNDSLTKAISKVFMVLVFGVLPGAVFVVFLILSLRVKKKIYRGLFRSIWILSAAEVAVFAWLMCILW